MIRFAKTAMILSLSMMLTACGIFGGGDDGKSLRPVTTALGVNGYLWQATLDTLAFLPIDNAYPSSGAIISDWYSTADAPDERVKVAVYFRSEQLRSDGIKVNVVRQERRDGAWLTVPVQAATVLQIEEAILQQARTLRIEADGA
ncbi:DUF3576 domain-containing protein [Kordiimonas aquimaris]|uniref:DUF3576 domain-containing protein n=1 Tax=Kordiimonas aquimaris TaxID=707591 RepID=UPI0021D06EE1|nr:DUF3576 domain-containing protein [Kordiimonas aquimaris]